MTHRSRPSQSAIGAAAPAANDVDVTASAPAADALVVEVQEPDGQVVLVLGRTRVAGLLRQTRPWLVEGTELDIPVLADEVAVGVVVRLLSGCRLERGAVARALFVGLDVGGRRLNPAPAAAAGLRGRLEEVALPDIVQLVCVGRREALIEVIVDDVDGAACTGGVIAFRDGQAVLARLHDGSGGEPAFFALIGASQGRFEVHFGRTVAGTNLDTDTTFLMLEAMRRIDEADRTPPPAVVVPSAGVEDAAFLFGPSLLPQPAAAPVADADEAAATPTARLRPSRLSASHHDDDAEGEHGAAHALEAVDDVSDSSYGDEHEGHEDHDDADDAERADRVERAERSDRFDRTDRTDRFERGLRGGGAGPVAVASSPATATGRFARFFEELSELVQQRNANSLLPRPAAEVSSPSRPPMPASSGDDVVHADPRFASLAVRLSSADDPVERDTEIMRRTASMPT
jgi:hypothetical protein